jgi:hypothetical protein
MSRLAEKIDAQVRRISKNRCGYCLLPQEILMGKLEIEHILPVSKGGTDVWKICVWLAVNVTAIKVQRFLQLMKKQAAK